MSTETLFTPHDLMRMEVVRNTTKKRALILPFLITAATLALLFQALVALIEWEIIFKIFDYIAGSDQQNWSPHLMAFSGLLMIAAYHLLAKSRPNNIAVMIVERLAVVSILIYAIGAGLFVASILYADGLGEIIEPLPSIGFGQIETALEVGWIDALFEDVTNPLAVVALSAGIGSMVIVNLFISHHLLSFLDKTTRSIYERTSEYRNVTREFKVVQKTQEAFREISDEIEELKHQDRNFQILHIASDAQDAISRGLFPHKSFVKENDHGLERSSLDPELPANPDKVAKDIAKIEAITLEEIMEAMRQPESNDKEN